MNFLDFANPMGFWWALLALPIIAFYILKVRLRRVPVTTMMFWNQLYNEKKPRSWWQRLRHWLSLLLQLAFLALLVGAIVDPLWSWQKQQQRRVVLVIDNSASMQAVEAEGQTRLQLAKVAAKALIHSLRDGDQMAIVASGGRPDVVSALTEHTRWLIEAIEGLEPTDAPDSNQASIELADRLLGGLEGEKETIVLTDGQSEDLGSINERAGVTVFGVGEGQNNVAITRYQVRRSLVDATGYQVLVDVSNFSDEVINTRLELSLDDELVDVLPIELPANETATRIINHVSTGGGRLAANIDFDDALELDNRAIAILPARDPIPVTLVTEGNVFVSSVLSSIPLVHLTMVAPDAVLPQDAANSVIVFDRKHPDVIPAGRVLVIDPQSECDLWKVGADLEQPIVASVDADSPLCRHVRLENVLFAGAKRLELLQGGKGLIRDPIDAPMFAHVSRPGGDVVVLTCSLERGDLPLRIAFPVLIKNTIEWFNGESGELRPTAQAGSLVTIPLDLPMVSDTANSPGEAGSTSVEVVQVAGDDVSRRTFELVSPDGTTVPISAADERATIGPLMRSGLWVVRTSADGQAKPEIEVACNLASATESDLRPRVELAQAQSELGMRLVTGRSLWFYLTLVALGLVVTEWWLYQRRIVG